MARPKKAQRPQIAQRRTQAAQMRLEGKSWAHIAEALGYSTPAAACQDLGRAIEQHLRDQAEAVETLRQLELARLDALQATAWDVMTRKHITVSHGKIVQDETGQALEDDGPTLQAIDRVVRIMERRARLEGLDSPVKLNTTGVVTFHVEGVDLDQLR
jgi:hypothetical protein